MRIRRKKNAITAACIPALHMVNCQAIFKDVGCSWARKEAKSLTSVDSTLLFEFSILGADQQELKMDKVKGV